MSDPSQRDYFEVISHMPGEQAARSCAQWQTLRGKAGKPISLEGLSEEKDENLTDVKMTLKRNET